MIFLTSRWDGVNGINVRRASEITTDTVTGLIPCSGVNHLFLPKRTPLSSFVAAAFVCSASFVGRRSSSETFELFRNSRKSSNGPKKSLLMALCSTASQNVHELPQPVSNQVANRALSAVCERSRETIFLARPESIASVFVLCR